MGASRRAARAAKLAATARRQKSAATARDASATSSSFLNSISALASAALSATTPGRPAAAAATSAAAASRRRPNIASSAALQKKSAPAAAAAAQPRAQRSAAPSGRKDARRFEGRIKRSIFNPFAFLGLPLKPDAATSEAQSASGEAADGASEAEGLSTMQKAGKRSNEERSRDAKQEAEGGPSASTGSPSATDEAREPNLPRAARMWKSLENVQGAAKGKLAGLGSAPETVEPLREMKVATLAHGLDRVLFNPGVHWLRDPRTGIYNFSPSLRNILDPDLFDYDALPAYITSSQDKELETIARRTQARYCGSTSSLTALLSQCYFLISGRKPPNLTGFSDAFKSMGHGFSGGASLPASIKLVYKPDHTGSDERAVYAIDADKSASGELENSNYVLAALGKSMEKMLTVDDNEFRRFQRVERWQRLARGESDPPSEPEAYHYSKLSRFMMRSQLDCYDPRLPNKTFDLKTRAAVAIRHDRANWVESSGYQIRSNLGLLESFEREYFDMIRAAFLKYGFQARIGNMDGIFVAYHNTKEIFGFQYVPLDEIFTRVFGTVEMGEQAFSLSVRLLEAILNSATTIYPKQSLKLTLSVSEGKDPHMTVYAEPAELSPESQQSSSKPQIQEPKSEQNPFGQSIDQAIANSSSETPQPLGNRSLVQIDVKVDRYLNGALVQGQPVDFAAVPGRAINFLKEDEIARRQRQKMAPLDWTVDYIIQPRSDLNEADVARHLQKIRGLQVSISSLTMPNLEAVAAREAELEAILLKTGGEAAVERWKMERREGKIGRMPRAPGQAPVAGEDAEEAASGLDVEEDGSEATSSTGGDQAARNAAQPDDAEQTKLEAFKAQTAHRLPHHPLPESAPNDKGEGTWTTQGAALRRVQHLRALARLGAQDRIAYEKVDRREQV
ncbi:hypothetical protein OC835_002005 [Tilletia horrida]|nr:hypothetical protein OC835_002005 [Tilletia horrida]